MFVEIYICIYIYIYIYISIYTHLFKTHTRVFSCFLGFLTATIEKSFQVRLRHAVVLLGLCGSSFSACPAGQLPSPQSAPEKGALQMHSLLAELPGPKIVVHSFLYIRVYKPKQCKLYLLGY